MADAAINWSSITLASVAAGPLFLLGLGIGVLAQHPGAAVAIDPIASILPAIPVIAMVMIFFGTIIALPVNLIGALLMTWLGNRNVAARLPAMWALAGGFACAVPILLLGSESPDSPPGTLVAFTFTGACCALVCRRRITW